MDYSKPKVLLGLPTMHSIHTVLAMIVMSWVSENKVPLRVFPTMGVQPVDNARNEIVKEFMEGEAKDCTHLLFIDSDTVPPQNVLYKLLEHNKAIVSALTPIIEYDEKTQEHYRKWNCVGLDDGHLQPHQGLKQIKGAGSSCILIRRDVFEKLEKPYYRFVYQDDNGKSVLVSEDIYFVIKAIAAGFVPYADTDLICQHQKAILW